MPMPTDTLTTTRRQLDLLARQDLALRDEQRHLAQTRARLQADLVRLAQTCVTLAQQQDRQATRP
jgi:hypothetical protein